MVTTTVDYPIIPLHNINNNSAIKSNAIINSPIKLSPISKSVLLPQTSINYSNLQTNLKEDINSINNQNLNLGIIQNDIISNDLQPLEIPQSVLQPISKSLKDQKFFANKPNINLPAIDENIHTFNMPVSYGNKIIMDESKTQDLAHLEKMIENIEHLNNEELENRKL